MIDTLMQVLYDEPVPPSRLQSKTPGDLETICLKCLHKEPSRRYASAEALARKIWGRFRRGELMLRSAAGQWVGAAASVRRCAATRWCPRWRRRYSWC